MCIHASAISNDYPQRSRCRDYTYVADWNWKNLIPDLRVFIVGFSSYRIIDDFQLLFSLKSGFQLGNRRMKFDCWNTRNENKQNYLFKTSRCLVPFPRDVRKEGCFGYTRKRLSITIITIFSTFQPKGEMKSSRRRKVALFWNNCFNFFFTQIVQYFI